MLSQYPPDRVAAILDDVTFEAKTENTIVEREAFLEELSDVADAGYAVDRGENTEGVGCIAVPITTGGKTPLGAISVTGPRRRFADAAYETRLVDRLLEAANVIDVNSRFP